MTPKLELRSVVAAYGATRVLHGVSLRVAEGQVTALLGANGAGKTTTLRVISGLHRAASGDILLDGASTSSRAPHQIAAAGVGHVPDGRGTILELSVEENMQVGAYLLRRKQARAERIDQVYGWFPVLRDRRWQQAGTLSGGEQQMLAIARAMIARPKLLLLDEPSFGVAPLIVRKIFDTLGEINRTEALTILLIEQNATLAFDVATEAYVLQSGAVAIHGRTDVLRSDPAVRRSYLGG